VEREVRGVSRSGKEAEEKSLRRADRRQPCGNNKLCSTSLHSAALQCTQHKG
jgi:hypothetical protein